MVFHPSHDERYRGRHSPSLRQPLPGPLNAPNWHPRPRVSGRLQVPQVEGGGGGWERRWSLVAPEVDRVVPQSTPGREPPCELPHERVEEERRHHPLLVDDRHTQCELLVQPHVVRRLEGVLHLPRQRVDEAAVVVVVVVARPAVGEPMYEACQVGQGEREARQRRDQRHGQRLHQERHDQHVPRHPPPCASPAEGAPRSVGGRPRRSGDRSAPPAGTWGTRLGILTYDRRPGFGPV